MPAPSSETKPTSDDKSQISVTTGKKIWDIFAIIISIIFVLILAAVALPGWSGHSERMGDSAAFDDLCSAKAAQEAHKERYGY